MKRCREPAVENDLHGAPHGNKRVGSLPEAETEMGISLRLKTAADH